MLLTELNLKMLNLEARKYTDAIIGYLPLKIRAESGGYRCRGRGLYPSPGPDSRCRGRGLCCRYRLPPAGIYSKDGQEGRIE